MSDNEDTISENGYQSLSEDDGPLTITYQMLKDVFEYDNVSFLKQVILSYITPVEIYNILGEGCFADIEDGEKEDPYTSIRCFKYLVKIGLPINITDECGETPLHYACRRNENAIFYILKMGGNPNIRNASDETPIDVYLQENLYREREIKVLKRAFDCGFDMKSNKRGHSILHFYCDGGDIAKYLSVVEFLIEKGFDINSKTDCGRTILHYQEDRRKNIKLLITKFYEWGFDFRAVDNKGVTAIDSFTRSNKQALWGLFLELEQKNALNNPKEPDC